MLVFKPYKEICNKCKQEKWIQNSRGICPDCVYQQNNGGRTKIEVAIERQRQKVRQLSQKNTNTFKSFKNSLKQINLKRRKEILEKDRKLYLYIFNTKPPICEECYKSLPDIFEDEDGNIIAIWQYSHILPKGAYQEFRHHKLNINRLCINCHNQWDFGNRKSMSIYLPNQEIIVKIKENPLYLI